METIKKAASTRDLYYNQFREAAKNFGLRKASRCSQPSKKALYLKVKVSKQISYDDAEKFVKSWYGHARLVPFSLKGDEMTFCLHPKGVK